jgi:hypothetical protein
MASRRKERKESRARSERSKKTSDTKGESGKKHKEKKKGRKEKDGDGDSGWLHRWHCGCFGNYRYEVRLKAAWKLTTKLLSKNNVPRITFQEYLSNLPRTTFQENKSLM